VARIQLSLEAIRVELELYKTTLGHYPNKLSELSSLPKLSGVNYQYTSSSKSFKLSGKTAEAHDSITELKSDD